MMKPLHLALGIGTLGGLLLFAFVPVSTLSPQPASTAYAQSTPSVSFTQEEVQGKEGSTIYLRVKLDTPVTKTTKVTIKLTPDAGTTSRDIPGLTGTKTVTFYKNGTQTKTVAIRTSRTTAEGDKSLTASITKVGNTTVQGDTARILVKDQRSSAPLTGNQNTNNQNTATTTPPVNCAQYEGVIPGETRRLNVVLKSVPHRKYNYPISAEAQAQNDSMRGQLGHFENFFDVPGSFGARSVQRIASGEVLVYQFKTAAEYNHVPAVHPKMYERPETPQGVVAMSVSECPADFTSPFFGGSKNWKGNIVIPGNGPGKDCLSIAPSAMASLEIAAGNPKMGVCNLEPNKTYYINITAGFSDPDGKKEGSMTPHIGKRVVGGTETTAGTWESANEMVHDILTWGRDIRLSTSAQERVNIEMIKGKSEFYAENRRVTGIVNSAAQQRTAQCMALVQAAIAQNRRTGNECRGLPQPTPEFDWVY